MYRRTTDYEYVELTPEGRFLTGALEEVPARFVQEACDVCEEPGSSIDPLGIFRDPAQPGSQATAHDLCASGEGWVLA
jgi:hypothetical protein